MTQIVFDHTGTTNYDKYWPAPPPTKPQQEKILYFFGDTVFDRITFRPSRNPINQFRGIEIVCETKDIYVCQLVSSYEKLIFYKEEILKMIERRAQEIIQRKELETTTERTER